MMSVANVHKHISIMQNKVVWRRVWSSSSIWSVTAVQSKSIYSHYDPSSNTLLLKLFPSDRLFDQFATNYFTLSQNMCATLGLV